MQVQDPHNNKNIERYMKPSCIYPVSASYRIKPCIKEIKDAYKSWWRHDDKVMFW